MQPAKEAASKGIPPREPRRTDNSAYAVALNWSLGVEGIKMGLDGIKKGQGPMSTTQTNNASQEMMSEKRSKPRCCSPLPPRLF